jgi:hypothetical protein
VKVRTWGSVTTLAEAKGLIDRMVLVRWQDISRVQRNLSDEAQGEVLQYFAHMLIKKRGNPMEAALVLEGVSIWMLHNLKEELIQSFLDEILSHERFAEICKDIVPVMVEGSISDRAHEEMIFSLSVVLVCELGVESLARLNPKNPEDLTLIQFFSSELATVSHRNALGVRLSLLHYFSKLYEKFDTKEPLNAFLRKSGRVVLDSLFSLLFHKKTETVALQYLMKHLPYILGGDAYVQVMVHEIFRAYLLRNPDRFLLFMKVFSQDFSASPLADGARMRVWVQQVSALFALCGELRNKALALALAKLLTDFQHMPQFDVLLEQLLEQGGLPGSYKELCREGVYGVSRVSVGPLSHKRGRKPGFSQVIKPLHDMGQAVFLSGLCTLKMAS